MDGLISFTNNGETGANVGDRHLVVAAAMRRYVPHVVTWRCLGAGAPIYVTLPESFSARELLRRAEREQVRLAAAQDPEAPDRVFEIYYAHLSEAEIEEGIRRLGRCLIGYSQLAAHNAPGQPSTLVGT